MSKHLGVCSVDSIFAFGENGASATIAAHQSQQLAYPVCSRATGFHRLLLNFWSEQVLVRVPDPSSLRQRLYERQTRFSRITMSRILCNLFQPQKCRRILWSDCLVCSANISETLFRKVYCRENGKLDQDPLTGQTSCYPPSYFWTIRLTGSGQGSFRRIS
jgi:hypothetical protein